MGEFNLLHMGTQNLGQVEIAPEVIEVIASLAASEVDGVNSMRGNFASGMVEKFGIKNHGKGVRVELDGEQIVLDVFVTIKYGESIPEVAENIQDNIRQTIMTMTGLEVKEVNVHIVGISFEKEKIEE